MEDIFAPQVLSNDLAELHKVYFDFFSSIQTPDWDKPVKGGAEEWNLHETVAHLAALNGAGLDSIKAGLRSQAYRFAGLDDRYQFNAYNRRGIDDHLSIPMKELFTEAAGILEEAAHIAGSLRPEQAQMTLQMPIYNRPVRVVEALSIIIFHTGLAHTSQVAEPAGVQPLWTRLSPAFRRRVIGRTVRCFSLLYRPDIGGPLRDTIVFRIDGPEGGEWTLSMSPEAPDSYEGAPQHPGLIIHLREPAIFYHMLTNRFSLPAALITGAMKLRGNLRLFLRMNTLLSIDARPAAAGREHSAVHVTDGG